MIVVDASETRRPPIGTASLRCPAILHCVFWRSHDGDAPQRAVAGDVGTVLQRDGGLLSDMPTPAVLPAWLDEADVEFHVGEFARTGFRGGGGLNWYRNIDRNWEWA
jgi:hypothetical protein